MNIEIGDVIYYRGLNYLTETFVFDISEDGTIHLNNGAKRKLEDIGKDIFLDKESANKTMIDVPYGRFI